MSILNVQGISKSIQHTQILRDISFSVEPGEIVSLIGPNGAGKSTLLKILSRLVFPDSGTVTIGRFDLNRQPEQALALEAAMIEEPPLYPQLTGKQHLELVARLRGKGQADVRRWAAYSRLGAKLSVRVTKYSLGMKQRLHLSMCLLAEPKLLILDEPTNGLDLIGVLEFRSELRRIADSGSAVVLTSHQLSDLEKVSDRYLFLRAGKLVFSAAASSVADIETAYLQHFGGGDTYVPQ